MPTLVFLHGFLGDPSDWEGVIAHLPGFRCTALPYPFVIPQGSILVGYSMGGRIALQHPHKKIVFSAHPGLVTDREKTARRAHEASWLALLEDKPDEFLNQWYAQELFASLRAHPSFPSLLERRKKHLPLARHQLLSHPLSQQPRNTDALFCYGEHDAKYATIYAGLPVQKIAACGHACHLENPEGCAEVIKDFVKK